MIGYTVKTHGNKITIANSKGYDVTSDQLEDLLEFLIYPEGNEGRVFWDIDQALSPLFRLMSKETLEKLFQTNRAWFRPYGITFHRRKSFYAVRGSIRAFYYHLAQYYPDFEEPDNPIAIGNLADKLIAELASIEVYPERLSSSVGLFDYIYREVPMPNWDDAPDDVGELADQCTRKHWVTALQIGHFNKVYDYDIGSAYPSVAANLMDFRYGKWINSLIPPAEAVYGFASGKVKITADISPIVYADRYGHLFNPKGTFQTVLTLGEIRMLEDLQLGSFAIENAWWWIPEKKVYPLHDTLTKLFNSRQQSPMLNKILKLAMNGIYGKTLQINDDGTNAPSYNPIWAAVIEAETRVKVTRTIYENDLISHLLHISTDGILLDKEADIVGNGGMGEWKLDSVGSALIVSSNGLFYGTKRPHQLTYDDAIALIKANPKANSWEQTIRRRVTIGDYLLSGADIGLLKAFPTGFSLDFDPDRDFPELPSNGQELLDGHYASKPLQAGTLTKPEGSRDG